MSEPWSMPWSAPVFTRPPHSWKGVRSVVMAFQPDPAGLAAVLPPALEPGEGAGIVTMLSYGWGDGHRTHPFNEAVVLVPVRLNGAEGNFVPFIYVTTDEAMIAGREIAGLAQEAGRHHLGARLGDRFHGSVTRWGTTVIDIRATSPPSPTTTARWPRSCPTASDPRSTTS